MGPGRKQPQDFILSNTAGLALERNACLRAVKHLCERLGFEPPPRTLHAFRHSFSTNFLRRVFPVYSTDTKGLSFLVRR